MTDRPDEPGPPPGWVAPSGPPDAAPGPLSSGWASEQPPSATYPPAYPPPQQQGWGPAGPAPAWTPPPAPPRPGVIPLRPLGVGEILDGAISTIRAKPRVMLGLSAVVAVVTQLLTLPVTWLLLRDSGDFSLTSNSTSAEADLSFTASAVTAAGIQVLITLVATLLLTGVLTVVLSKAVLGQDIDSADAWAQTRPRIPTLLGVTLLVIAIELGLALVTIGPGLVLALAGAPGAAVAVVLVVGILAMVGLGVYLYVLFTLAPVAVVLERQGVRASLRRSRTLVRGAWWRTCAILVLVNVLAQVISGVVSVPFSLLALGAAWLQGGNDDLNIYALFPLLVTSVGSILASTITWPFTAVSTALLYVDRRIRREALDISLARAAGVAPTGTTATPGTPLDGPVGPAPPATAARTATLSTAVAPPRRTAGRRAPVPLLPVQVPVELGRDEAAQAARDELAKQIYRDARPSLTQRLLSWLWDHVSELFDRAAGASPGGWPGLLVVAAVVVLAVVALRLRLGPVQRAAARDQPLFAGRPRTAAEHRAAADAHAAAGRWAEAVRDRLRAVITGLEERSLLDLRPGRTADEAAAAAAAVVPSSAAALRDAARVFDEVWYGARPATADQDRALRELDEAVRAARPLAPPAAR